MSATTTTVLYSGTFILSLSMPDPNDADSGNGEFAQRLRGACGLVRPHDWPAFLPMPPAARAKLPASATRTKDNTSTMSVDERCIIRNTIMPDARLPATHMGAYLRLRNANRFHPKGR